ncbi:MAG: PaaX family transcriptional regulator [Proteobacteria bacterium]|nr:PaaX family transcriptional regulator [Pseudomonadota bacterium]
MKPTAKSLVLDLLSTLQRGTMPVRALVDAGALFGLAENNIRVTLARLYASGLVERDERGAYRLGNRTAAVQRQLSHWRHLSARLLPWDESWIGVHTSGIRRGRGRARRRREQALRFLGFRELDAGLLVRPNNLTGGVKNVRAQLVDLGLEAGGLVFGIDELDPSTDVRARSLWDGAALVQAYAVSRRELDASSARLPRLALEDAMVETFLLGGRVLRQLALDPLLPEPMVPEAERNALVGAMRRYDREGRVCWRNFLARHDVEHASTPLDARVGTSHPSFPPAENDEGADA